MTPRLRRSRPLLAVLAFLVLCVSPPAAAAKPDFSGTWMLDPEASEDPFEIMRDRLDNRRRVYKGGRAGGPIRRQPGVEPPPSFGGEGLRNPDAGIERLEIEHADPRISIRFADDRELVFFTDGRAALDDFELGLLAVSGKWKRDEIVFNAESAYGGKVRETYALSDDGARLSVTIRREGDRNSPGIAFTRVYVRSASWEGVSSGAADAEPRAPGSR